MKSGYHVAMDDIKDLEAVSTPINWDKIWNLHVPPKVKKMVWRAAKECLPTRLILGIKGLMVSPTCPRCPNDPENA